jgi:Predicted membrane protein
MGQRAPIVPAAWLGAMRNRTKLVIAGVGVAAVLGGGGAVAAATAASAGAPAASAPDARPVAVAATGEPGPDGATDKITRERAIEIAEKRVPGARVTDVEREWEHGRRTWEVELRKGGTEYDVHVSAESGEIVKFDEERDDRHDGCDDHNDDHDDGDDD